MDNTLAMRKKLTPASHSWFCIIAALLLLRVDKHVDQARVLGAYNT